MLPRLVVVQRHYSHQKRFYSRVIESMQDEWSQDKEIQDNLDNLRPDTCNSCATNQPQEQRDFFGIADVTSKEIAGSKPSNLALPKNILTRKYDPLLTKRNRLESEDKNFDVTFGRMRYDQDNVAKTHGQYEPGGSRKMYDTKEIKQMFVRDDTEEDLVKVPECPNEDKALDDPLFNSEYKLSEIKATVELSDVLDLFQKQNREEDMIKYANKPPLTFFFEETIDSLRENTVFKDSSKIHIGTNIEIGSVIENRSSDDVIQNLKPKILAELEETYRKKGITIDDLDPMSEEYFRRLGESRDDFDFDKRDEKKIDVREQPSQNMRPSDYLKQVRETRVEPSAIKLKKRLQKTDRYDPILPELKLDSKGYQNYTHQVPNWDRCRRVDILDHLKESIVYNNYDILAVNKPYGIPSHSEDKGSERLDMNSLMQELATSMKIEKIYLAHRLDKTTTGVLMFATSKDRAAKLNKLFKADEIKKTYWCITKGVPDQDAAVIDIPIGQFKVAGKLRSCPAPEFIEHDRQLAESYQEARRAVTEYRVLTTSANMSLIEVRPKSGVKHQIRCHLGFGLNTPILGDHKYSHIGRIAPQKLSPPALAALRLRQEKVRTLPLHLHALSVVVPRAKANGETLFINAPLPQHFVMNLKALKLYHRDMI